MSAESGQYGGADAPVAGWYADPNGTGHRWWDGRQWTEHVSAPASGPVAPAAAATAVATAWAPETAPTYGGPTAPSAYGTQGSPAAYFPQGSAPLHGNQGVPGGGYPYPYAPAGPAPKNGIATAGFVLGIVCVTVGVMTGYWVGSLVAVLLSANGLRRAKTLASTGQPAVGRNLAIWGIVLSLLSWVVALVLRFAAR